MCTLCSWAKNLGNITSRLARHKIWKNYTCCTCSMRRKTTSLTVLPVYIRVCHDPVDTGIENNCAGRPGSATRCNTNCYTHMYKDTDGEIYAVRGCNDGNQLPKDLKDSSTYNLGKFLKILKSSDQNSDSLLFRM